MEYKTTSNRLRKSEELVYGWLSNVYTFLHTSDLLMKDGPIHKKLAARRHKVVLRSDLIQHIITFSKFSSIIQNVTDDNELFHTDRMKKVLKDLISMSKKLYDFYQGLEEIDQLAWNDVANKGSSKCNKDFNCVFSYQPFKLGKRAMDGTIHFPVALIAWFEESPIAYTKLPRHVFSFLSYSALAAKDARKEAFLQYHSGDIREDELKKLDSSLRDSNDRPFGMFERYIESQTIMIPCDFTFGVSSTYLRKLDSYPSCVSNEPLEKIQYDAREILKYIDRRERCSCNTRTRVEWVKKHLLPLRRGNRGRI